MIVTAGERHSEQGEKERGPRAGIRSGQLWQGLNLDTQSTRWATNTWQCLKNPEGCLTTLLAVMKVLSNLEWLIGTSGLQTFCQLRDKDFSTGTHRMLSFGSRREQQHPPSPLLNDYNFQRHAYVWPIFENYINIFRTATTFFFPLHVPILFFRETDP